MKRFASIALLCLLLLASAAQASLLRGSVTSVNRVRHSVAVLDAHHRLHVLRYRGPAPRAQARATFQLRHGYAVLLGREVASATASRRRPTVRPRRRVNPPTTTSTTTSGATTTSQSATVTSASATESSSTTTSISSTSSTSTFTTPQPVPAHIETWAYDDGCNGGRGAPASLVQSWLTYAESNCGPAATKAPGDCGAVCTSIAYLDAEKIYAQGSVPVAQAAQEGWWLHQPGYGDAAHRLVANIDTWGNSQMLDQANPAVQSWLQNYARTSFGSFSGLMMDDTGPSLSQQLYGTGRSASQELVSDSALLSAHEALAAGMTKPDGSHFLQVDNSLSPNPWLPSPFGLLGHGDGVHGFVAEGQPVSGGSLTSWYSSLLDDLSYVDAQPNAFIALLSYDDNGSLTSRRLQAATVLLGYSPGHVVSWSALEQSSPNLAVWPEAGLYPTQPIQSMAAPGGAGCLAGKGQVCSTGGHNDIQVAPGVYRREFRTCYDRGTAIGPCATVVNDTSAPVTIPASWLTQSYGHEITMVGGDVQSGGSIDPAGAPFATGSTTVPADDAVLLAN